MSGVSLGEVVTPSCLKHQIVTERHPLLGSLLPDRWELTGLETTSLHCLKGTTQVDYADCEWTLPLITLFFWSAVSWILHHCKQCIVTVYYWFISASKSVSFLSTMCDVCGTISEVHVAGRTSDVRLGQAFRFSLLWSTAFLWGANPKACRCRHQCWWCSLGPGLLVPSSSGRGWPQALQSAMFVHTTVASALLGARRSRLSDETAQNTPLASSEG